MPKRIYRRHRGGEPFARRARPTLSVSIPTRADVLAGDVPTPKVSAEPKTAKAVADKDSALKAYQAAAPQRFVPNRMRTTSIRTDAHVPGTDTSFWSRFKTKAKNIWSRVKGAFRRKGSGRRRTLAIHYSRGKRRGVKGRKKHRTTKR